MKSKHRNGSGALRIIVLLTMTALLSTGTARGATYNATVLNPTGFSDCFESAISGGQQGGYGFSPTASHYHALLWSGSVASAVDLHPNGFDNSEVNGIYGN